jgi:hypothetical protein
MKFIKKISLILLAVFTIVSCNNDDGLVTNPPTGSTYNAGSDVNRDFLGLILDTSGNPVANANVVIGTSTTQTNARGIFSIKNASVKERFAHVKVTKTGFVNGSRVLVPTAGANRVNIMLIPNTPTQTVASGANSEVTSNGTKVKFDGFFTDASGNAYSGNVAVSLYHLKKSDTYLNEIMPGSLLGSSITGEAKALETFGMLHVELTGTAGQKLNLATGHSAEITMDIDPSQLASAPASMPLWSFDETSGMWKEEGSATKVANKYVGTVSHFSWWNADYPYPYCTLAVTVHNSSNQPVSNLLVCITQVSGYTRGNTTNVLGTTSGTVPATENLVLTIKDPCGNVLYTANIGPFNQNSVNILPTIVLPPSATTTTVTGILQTCSNTNVVDGLAVIRIPGTTNFFNQTYVPVTNGAFSFVINTICGTSPTYEFQGEDFTNSQLSVPFNFIATPPVTNIGIITTCTSVIEYITYIVDNDPTRSHINNINATYSITGGLNVTTQNQSSFFSMNSSNNPPIGSFLNNYGIELTVGTTGIVSGIGAWTTFPSNVTLTVANIDPVGGYITFTFDGTFTDATGSHVVSGTGQVIRD